MTKLGFTCLHICSSIFYKHEDGTLCIVFDYVDDFVFSGNNNTYTLALIAKFRSLAQTTEPDNMNASNLLGMELVRDRNRRTISIRMTQRIADLTAIFPQATLHKRNVPIPTSAYIVLDPDFESLPPSSASAFFIPNRSHYLYADRGFTHMDPDLAPQYLGSLINLVNIIYLLHRIPIYHYGLTSCPGWHFPSDTFRLD
jgi:hypothetical protein